MLCYMLYILHFLHTILSHMPRTHTTKHTITLTSTPHPQDNEADCPQDLSDPVRLFAFLSLSLPFSFSVAFSVPLRAGALLARLSVCLSVCLSAVAPLSTLLSLCLSPCLLAPVLVSHATLSQTACLCLTACVCLTGPSLRARAPLSSTQLAFIYCSCIQKLQSHKKHQHVFKSIHIQTLH
jgi:hypothetical protein